MRSTRIAISAAVPGALALPMLSAAVTVGAASEAPGPTGIQQAPVSG